MPQFCRAFAANSLLLRMLRKIKRRETRAELRQERVSHWVPGRLPSPSTPSIRKRAREVRRAIDNTACAEMLQFGQRAASPMPSPPTLERLQRTILSDDDEIAMPRPKKARRIECSDDESESDGGMRLTEEAAAVRMEPAAHAEPSEASVTVDILVESGAMDADGTATEASAQPQAAPPRRIAIGDDATSAKPSPPALPNRQLRQSTGIGIEAEEEIRVVQEAEPERALQMARPLQRGPIRIAIGDDVPSPPPPAQPPTPAQQQRMRFDARPAGAVDADGQGGADGDQGETNSERSASNHSPEHSALTGACSASGGACSASGGVHSTSVQPWTEQAENAKVQRAAKECIDTMPPAWREQLCSYGGRARLPIRKRIALTRKKLERLSYGQLSGLRRAIAHLHRYLRDEKLCFEDVACKDVCIDALEEYSDAAKRAARERAAKRAAKRLPPRRNDRGGATATMPIYLGMRRLAKLGIDIAVPDDDVKEVARAGPGMPAVQPLMSLASVETLEQGSCNSERSKFERAYSGGGWLTVAGSTRCIDLQRTAKVRFERCNVLGRMTTVACGVARRSKAASQLEMRPLAWRAPVIPIGCAGEVDLRPLLASMPSNGSGCVFRDFSTPEGARHSIVHATAWIDKPASYQTIVRSLRDLTGQADLGTHNGRHVTPEVGLALKLPKQIRERLGYWREQPVTADSADDQRAMERAIAKARERHTRASALAAMPDRYASVDADVVVSDNARATCLLACRDAMAKWGPGNCPSSTREQIACIANDAQ